MRLGLHRLLDSFYRPLFGEDVFISYSRFDGSEYAKSLFVKLTDDKKGLTCFIDELGTEPGKDIPTSLRRKVRNCSMLILVGSPSAAKSQAVSDEIIEFLTVRRNRERIVPIDVGGGLSTAVWREKIIGVDIEPETDADALTKGIVSPNVIDRILRAAKYRKQNDRLRRVRNGTLTLLLTLLLLSGWAGVYAYQQLQAAARANDEARQAIARAGAADQEAREAREIANKAREDANAAIADANRKIEQAEVKRTEAEAAADAAEKATEVAEKAAEVAQRLEEEAKKEATKQQDIANSRRIAVQAERSLSDKPDSSLVLSAAAFKKYPTFEAKSSVLATLNQTKNMASILRHGSREVTQVNASPDGSTLVTADVNGRIVFWNMADKKPRSIHDSIAEDRSPIPLALTPDGRKLVALGYGSMLVWDVATPEKHYDVKPEIRRVGYGYYAVAAHPDNKTVVTSNGRQGELVFWDISNPAEPKRIYRFKHGGGEDEHYGRGLMKLAFTPDGKQLLMVVEKGGILRWDVSALDHPKPLAGLEVPGHKIARLLVSPDGKWFASADTDGNLYLWNATTLAYKELKVAAKRFAFSEDSQRLAATGGDKNVSAWVVQDLWDGKHSGNSIVGTYSRDVQSVAFSNDSKFVISGNNDGTVTFWRLGGRSTFIQQELTGNWESLVWGTASSPNNRMLAVRDIYGAVLLADLTNGSQLVSPADSKVSGPGNLAFSTDGRTLIAGSKDGSITLWEESTGWKPVRLGAANPETTAPGESPTEEAAQAEVSIDDLSFVSFAAGGKEIVSVRPEGVVIWDITTKHAVRRIPLPDQNSEGLFLEMLSVAASRDGEQLAIGYNDGAIAFLNTKIGQPSLKLLAGHKQAVRSLAFSYDGRWLTSFDSNDVGHMWKLGGDSPTSCGLFFPFGEPLITPNARFLNTSSSDIQAVAFIQEDKTLALATQDGITLWDIDARSVIGEIEITRSGGHRNFPSAFDLSLSKDGKTLAAGTNAGAALLDVDPESWAKTARAIATREFNEIEQQFMSAGGVAGCDFAERNSRRRGAPQN